MGLGLGGPAHYSIRFKLITGPLALLCLSILVEPLFSRGGSSDILPLRGSSLVGALYRGCAPVASIRALIGPVFYQ